MVAVVPCKGGALLCSVSHPKHDPEELCSRNLTTIYMRYVVSEQTQEYSGSYYWL